MRFTIELRHRPHDNVEGTVAAESAAPVAFSGWLELLRLLEAPHEKRAEPPSLDEPPSTASTRE